MTVFLLSGFHKISPSCFKHDRNECKVIKKDARNYITKQRSRQSITCKNARKSSRSGILFLKIYIKIHNV